MKLKFKRNQSVTVKCGAQYYSGIITDVRCNPCTYATEYSVDYYKNGTVWTLIGVPENALTPKIIKQYEDAKVYYGRSVGLHALTSSKE